MSAIQKYMFIIVFILSFVVVGKQHAAAEGRNLKIVGGVPAAEGACPWQVSLYLLDEGPAGGHFSADRLLMRNGC